MAFDKPLKLQKKERSRLANIVADSVKTRHIGDGIRFIRSGLAANRPVRGEKPEQSSSTAWYFAYDTNVLSVYNPVSESWVTFQFAA